MARKIELAAACAAIAFTVGAIVWSQYNPRIWSGEYWQERREEKRKKEQEFEAYWRMRKEMTAKVIGSNAPLLKLRAAGFIEQSQGTDCPRVTQLEWLINLESPEKGVARWFMGARCEGGDTYAIRMRNYEMEKASSCWLYTGITKEPCM